MDKYIQIGSRREVCWDEYLLDQSQNVRIEMHKPEYRDVALSCDMPWEGNVCGYFQVLQEGRTARLYYRGGDLIANSDGTGAYEGPMFFCYAQSTDGKHFTRIPTHLREDVAGENSNIFYAEPKDNVCVCYDTNPDCPADARYKALVGEDDCTLTVCKSADGIHFEKMYTLGDDGAFDSMNLAFWDRHTKQYFIYYRGLHNGLDGSNFVWGQEKNGPVKIIRDVRVRTSKDFIHWSEPMRLNFGPEAEDYELYTNQVKPYYRADHVFLGIPTRYMERWDDVQNFKYLPDYKNRKNLVKLYGRSGTAMTDCVLMTSRDGVNFRRTDEAFLTAGPEREYNWYYGDGYVAWGMLETEGDRPGAPKEISLYMGNNYRAKSVDLCRYALRLDGFFSWRADHAGGEILTKPVIFEGNQLEINFATSALGHVRIFLCNEDGEPIEGYDSGRLFGDSVDRPVDFVGELSALLGKVVRIKIELKDADIYSFRFSERTVIG